VPKYQSLIWSTAALAADIALLSFLAAIIAAPLFYTVVINSLSNHPSSFITFLAGVPPILA